MKPSIFILNYTRSSTMFEEHLAAKSSSFLASVPLGWSRSMLRKDSPFKPDVNLPQETNNFFSSIKNPTIYPFFHFPESPYFLSLNWLASIIRVKALMIDYKHFLQCSCIKDIRMTKFNHISKNLKRRLKCEVHWKIFNEGRGFGNVLGDFRYI